MQQENVPSNTLFVWRDLCEYRHRELQTKCPYCSINGLPFEDHKYYDSTPSLPGSLTIGYFEGYRCPLCGWFNKKGTILGYTGYAHLGTSQERTNESILRSFSIDSCDIALDELGTHLKHNFSDIYQISPRRFEELIEDVFKNLGFRTEITKQSRDGGADLFLLYDGNIRHILIECKRYKKNRRIGIDIIDRLVGAQVNFEVRKAKLITTSGFSSLVKDRIDNIRSHGFEIDLVDAGDLLNMFAVYNTKLPRIDHLRQEDIEEIIKANSFGTN